MTKLFRQVNAVQKREYVSVATSLRGFRALRASALKITWRISAEGR